jgi:nicotinamide phosphoribosyltransferase
MLATDSYKLSHFRQYPPKTKYVSSYIEAREGAEYNKIVFFGLQAFIKKHLRQKITVKDVEASEKIITAHGLPFNKEAWLTMIKDHEGYLPLKITAVPEGTVMAPGNVLVQVQNTDPRFPWVTSYIETALLRAIWYPTTVATISRSVKEIIWDALLRSSDDPQNQIMFKLHDFGARGVSSQESAELGGMAHLVNFMGTDTLESLLAVQAYYNTSDVVGFSIPASEHSTITSWGKENEVKAFGNMLDQFPEGLVACVSDSFDIYNACSELWGSKLRDKVMNRKGTLVVRPDSGDPIHVVSEVMMRLWTKFPGKINERGYKVLPDYIRVIQGDGCTPDMIKKILNKIMDLGYSADNIAFGMGGGLLQKCDRDTLRFAMKANAVDFGNGWIDVFKDPITGGGKVSKKGRLALIKDGEGEYKTVREDNLKLNSNHLRTVYAFDALNDVEVWDDYDTFQDVRDRAALK